MSLGPELSSRYQRISLLARGGMADVFQADDVEGKPVAIKVLRAGYAEDAEMVARFKREARAASLLKSKHIVRILEFGTTDGDRPYMVMERLFGHDVATEIKQRARLPLEEAATFLAHACHAVIEAHAAGVVHRDLKPRNLFLAQEGSRQVLKVLDFGIAKHFATGSDDPVTLTKALFGSPFYMAPETFRSAKNADARSDVWSLGVIFYEMLCGMVPFQRETALAVGLAVTKEAHVPITQRVPELPRSCDVVLSRALKKNPDERYQSVRELLAAIEVYLPGGRNDTMAIPTVQAAPDDDARTVRNEGMMVTEFGMVPMPVPSDPDTYDAPTRIKRADDDPATVARMVEDPATVARMPVTGETSRAERPVAISTLPAEPVPAASKRALPKVWLAVPGVALAFGLGGWLLGRDPSPAPSAPASRGVATEETAAAQAPPVDAPVAAPSSAPESASAAPSASDAPAPSVASDASDSASPELTPNAAPRPGGPLPKPTKKGKGKKYIPEKI